MTENIKIHADKMTNKQALLGSILLEVRNTANNIEDKFIETSLLKKIEFILYLNDFIRYLLLSSCLVYTEQ